MTRTILMGVLLMLMGASAQASLVILYQDESFLESGTSVSLAGASPSNFRLEGDHKKETSKAWKQEAICDMFVGFAKKGTSAQDFNSEVNVCYDAYMEVHAHDYDASNYSWYITVSSLSPDSKIYRKLVKKCWWAETTYGRNGLTCETVKLEKPRDYPPGCYEHAAPFTCP